MKLHQPKDSLEDYLPGLLTGARVALSDGLRGTILATGHAYGPGSGEDQAYVEFDPTWREPDPEDPHPARRKGRWSGGAGWFYLSSLRWRPDEQRGAT